MNDFKIVFYISLLMSFFIGFILGKDYKKLKNWFTKKH